MTNSHARRFVRSAWTLLSFQLVASVGAVAVTGLAAFHVQRMAAELEGRLPQEAATEAVEARAEVPGEAPRAEAALPTEAPADSAVRTDQPAAAATDAPAAAEAAAPPADPTAISACSVQSRAVRVPANGQWCDTGIQLQFGQRMRFATRGPEGLQSATIGRVGDFTFRIGAGADVIVHGNGPLQLRIDSASGDGVVEVSFQTAPAP